MPPRSDHRLQRLFLAAELTTGAEPALEREQAAYLLTVLRLGEGDRVLVFDGRNGEWLAEIHPIGRRDCRLTLLEQTRPQAPLGDLDWLFAPLKHARLDYMVQKAVEMGAARLRPVLTRHTQVTRLNLERMRANVVEAAEQCGLVALPEVAEPVDLATLLDAWPTREPDRRLLFCDEHADTTNPLGLLAGLPRGPLAVLIGPEGGFAAEERARLHAAPFVTAIPLGPRILRADTAAVAALAVVQAVLGDW
ncbi:16S rRNA (uracil(1498)-N(3))-methyltransferase [Siculibacillus lacustris]|uniref:Ribosomal RNA small subunit methyltransferase E n=1 Tax=Siculibacillus lacustris TaxID=1549641 RepID=A0A4V2KTG8_9HYPH|nr:16S rRNA (uracil(1498)-N(3))-methyltransferase [Siculibacillus lacustris]TBW37204.1 16S rRNA (uracil(1498)-N(3))-methyltransferase [Siculibacillus lacustris]